MRGAAAATSVAVPAAPAQRTTTHKHAHSRRGTHCLAFARLPDIYQKNISSYTRSTRRLSQRYISCLTMHVANSNRVTKKMVRRRKLGSLYLYPPHCPQDFFLLTYTPPFTLHSSRKRSADRRWSLDMGARRPLASASAIFLAATVTCKCHFLLRARADSRSWFQQEKKNVTFWFDLHT